uniref:Uncharacterized protein n=1 Tax=Arundo donax TaxID=35708 RepID=A0A0A8ZG27_ARUDO
MLILLLFHTLLQIHLLLKICITIFYPQLGL